MITAATITDDQIRTLRRDDPTLIDTLMIAIHSLDVDLRGAARARFAEILNTRSVK